MSTTMDKLERRLDAWADWFILAGSNGLGYRDKTPVARLKEHGGIWAYSTGEVPMPVNEAAEEIERWVQELAVHDVALARAIRCRYFELGTLASQAKGLGISKALFRTQVALAKQWLLGRACGKKA